MGTFTTKFRIWNPARPESAQELAELGEMEVLGAHSIKGLGLAADPVQKRLTPTVMLALAAR